MIGMIINNVYEHFDISNVKKCVQIEQYGQVLAKLWQKNGGVFIVNIKHMALEKVCVQYYYK